MTLDPNPRRIVVTGLGVVSSVGCSLESFWKNIRGGISGAAPVTRFDTSNAPTRIAAEVKDFDSNQFMDSKTAKRLDPSLRYSVAAAQLAATDAQIDFSKIDADRGGVVEATSVSNNETAARTEEAYARRGYRAVSPAAMINGWCGGGSGEVALQLGCRGHSITCSSGSASGNDAIGYALDMIRSDEVDIMVAVGAEAPIIPQIWGVFCQSKVMTRRNDSPSEAMRPFDRSRDGFVLGEGGAGLVLEELSHALARGARIYAEVLGHGRSCEAYHPVAPHPEAIGVIRAMEKALRKARVHPEEIDYVNVHGTATALNDVVETKAIKKIFADYASRVAVSSTKPVTGHLLAAAGAIESVVSVLTLHHGEIPMTLNLTDPDEGCDLDYVPRVSRPYPVRIVMSLNSGFGGKNSCLLFGRYSGNR